MKLSPRILTILKYLFAFTLLGMVLHKVGLAEIGSHLKEISPLEGLAALALASVAQVFSAMRMRYFFTVAGLRMSKHFAIVLYYVGAFYNFLLPGGIGGDAYKVVLVRKRLEMPYLQGIRIMVADRASGLCIVMLTMFTGLYLCGFGQAIAYGNLLLMLAAIVTPTVYIIASKRLLKQLPHDMLQSLEYSALAQLFWMGTLVLLWHAIGHGDNLVGYITLYCAASIASLIPLSVGGLGLREMTYFYGAHVMQQMVGLNVNADIGIALSLCMFALMFITSLPGLFWLNRVSKVAMVEPIKDNFATGDDNGDIRARREDWN